MSEIGKQIIAGLKSLNRSIERGTVTKDNRVSVLIKGNDGKYKTIRIQSPYLGSQEPKE